MTSPKHSPSEPTTTTAEHVITSIAPNDVVLGRGNHIHIDGNTKFRQLVHARSTEYWSCQDNFAKDLIARQIVDTVTSRGGRFLRKVRNAAAGGDEEQWELANKETVLVKVKQTFRDFSASHRKQQSAAAAASKVHSSSTAGAVASGDARSSFLPHATEGGGESSTTNITSAMAADQLPLSRAALPSDFLQSRLNDGNLRELLLLRELRANQLNRLLSNEAVQQHPMLPQYSALATDDRPLRSLLEQASLLRLLPPSAQPEASSSLLISPEQRQMSQLLSSRLFQPALSNTAPDVSELYQRLLLQQQRAEIPSRSVPSAASLWNIPAPTAYQDALQSIHMSRLLEEMSSQQPSQLQQLLAQERRQVLPSYFQSSLGATMAATDRVPLLNPRSGSGSQTPSSWNIGLSGTSLERPSEGKDQSPTHRSERKTAPEEESSGKGDR